MKPFILIPILLIPYGAFCQNVGIGITGPTAKLEVKNPVMSAVRISSNNYTDSAQLRLSNRNPFDQGTDFIFTVAREEGLYLTTASDIPNFIRDSLMSFLVNGSVGIGSKSPYQRLVLNDPGSTSCFIAVNNSSTGYGSSNGLLVGMSGNNALLLNHENGSLEFGTNNATQMLINAAGNIGFGVSPTEKIDVAGNIRATGSFTGLGVTVSGNISSGNNISASGTITATGEFQRASTGTTNLVPIAWGFVSSTGTALTGTSSGNFTVTHTSTGFYEIAITGESYQFQTYSAVATPIGAFVPRIIGTGSGSGKLQIGIFDINGADVDEDFNFVVYKK